MRRAGIGERLRRYAPALVALTVSLGMTLGVYVYALRVSWLRQEALLSAIATDTKARLTRRVEGDLALLNALRGLFEASQRVTQAEFDRYMASIQLGQHFAGVDAVLYAVDSAFGVHVRYASPKQSELDVGLDLSRLVHVRAALERAMVTGGPTATHGTDTFWVFLPVYAASVPPDATEGERRSGVEGYVGVRFRTAWLLEDLVASVVEPTVGYAVYDASASAGERKRLLASSAVARSADDSSRVQLPVRIAQRQWALVVFPRDGPSLLPRDGWDPGLLAAAGLLASALIFGLAALQTSRRLSAERANQQLTESQHALAESKAAAEAEQRRTAMLSDIGARLPMALQDLGGLMSFVARRVVPLLGEACAIDVIEDGRVAHRSVAHVDAGRERALRALLDGHAMDELLAASERLDACEAGVFDPRAAPWLSDVFAEAEREVLLGTLRVASMLLIPMCRAQGHLLGVVVLFSERAGRYDGVEQTVSSDVGHRCALAIHNAYLWRELQRSLRVRDEFLAVAAHELKTPVTSIRGYAQLIRSWSPEQLQEKGPRAAQILDRQTERINRLVQELLELSRVQLGRLELYTERTDLRALLAEVIETMRPVAQDHHLTLVEGVPVHANVDRGRIEEVLTNLISNAIKFSPKGGDIRVGLYRRNAEAVVYVQDAGIGIPVSQHPHVFERFFRAHARGPHAAMAGLGMGLFISKEFVERHGGRIWFESAEGQGSTFYFSLPCEHHESSSRKPPTQPG